MANIQKADPQVRCKAIKSLIIGAMVGIGLFLLFNSLIGNLNQWIENNAEFLVEHHYVAFLMMLVPVAPVIALSIYLIRYAGKIVTAQRFPPPDTPVISDVRVVEGKARRYAEQAGTTAVRDNLAGSIGHPAADLVYLL
jgi:hypothetical protein